MDLEQVSRVRSRYLSVAVYRHVQCEVDSRDRRYLSDGIVHRVALGYAPGRLWAADASSVVQVHGRGETRESRSHHLGAAGKPGEKMRLDEPGGDAHVGIEPPPVEQDRHAVPRLAGRCQAPSIESVVVDDLVAADHIGSEHGREFGCGVGPVGTGGDEHCDPLCRDVIQLT